MLLDRPTNGGAASENNADAALPILPTLLRRWSREPLVQFLLIGLILFGGYSILHPKSEDTSGSNRIVLTPDDLVQMTVAWRAQGRPPPTPEQMQNLIELKIREEVLFREATALGLDKDDTIVKRRLAQKMEFLVEGASIDTDPSTDTLRAWFKDNQQRFALLPRVSFRHLYFSSDRHGERTREAAAKALEQVAGQTSDAKDVAAVGDPFMYQDYYGDRSFDDMAKLFGLNFARALVNIKPGSWQGPVESGYGWHLIFVDSAAPRRVPAFEEIESDIKASWVADQRTQARAKAYEAMRARYQVVLPEKP
ncbi:peptidyl-prolyl cis-trans isomerase [Bradyrhizobium pachyrhizi]|uniref:peptidylprolyl isomerase n=1 Tax=Bradyrhizobium pachyrhizi TaxID=280333 RepID=UPI003D3677F9